MPELPEVETVAQELKRKVLLRTFVDVWLDNEKIIKKPSTFQEFKKQIVKRKIENIERRGKNILFRLSGKKTLLLHLKMTGHPLLGKWRLQNGTWTSLEKGAMREKVNSYIRVIFFLDNGFMLALSDLRRFAKIELWENKALENAVSFRSLGAEPLDKNFSFENFKKRIKNKKGRVKQVLMDQTVIAGIGNIYSDEILWEAKVNPFKKTTKLSDAELGKIFKSMKETLKKGIRFGGDSISDFRNIKGGKGKFDSEGKAYHKKICQRCGAEIKKQKIAGRTCHFCPKCQK